MFSILCKTTLQVWEYDIPVPIKYIAQPGMSRYVCTLYFLRSVRVSIFVPTYIDEDSFRIIYNHCFYICYYTYYFYIVSKYLIRFEYLKILSYLIWFCIQVFQRYPSILAAQPSQDRVWTILSYLTWLATRYDIIAYIKCYQCTVISWISLYGEICFTGRYNVLLYLYRYGCVREIVW